VSDLTLFDTPPHPRYRRSDPVTSVLAARSVKAGTPAAILDVLRSSPVPLTADQLAAYLPFVRRDTLRSALAGLHGKGRVVDAGIGVSDAGCPMQKWRLA
jgi:hypothetical protein